MSSRIEQLACDARIEARSHQRLLDYYTRKAIAAEDKGKDPTKWSELAEYHAEHLEKIWTNVAKQYYRKK